MPEPEDAPHPVVDDQVVTVRVRRAPKFAVFLVLGAALGLLVALILTFAFHGTDDKSPNTGLVYTSMQVFGFVALVCIAAGVLLGGAVALILDRTVGRRTREVAADLETTRLPD
ncbi:potassium transporter Trk [Microbacterium sp. CJ88]|uniref:potassium transporter Trk n=1 Tax=Microbacterium sp. CJ88 TaxID=3445672 RepID=UPI003F65F7F0